MDGLGMAVSTMVSPAEPEAGEMPALHLSVVRGDVAVCSALLALGSTDVSERDATGNCALHFAADRGLVALARLLLDRGADLHAEDALGNTPLMLAELCDHADMVQLLRERGALR